MCTLTYNFKIKKASEKCNRQSEQLAFQHFHPSHCLLEAVYGCEYCNHRPGVRNTGSPLGKEPMAADGTPA